MDPAVNIAPRTFYVRILHCGDAEQQPRELPSSEMYQSTHDSKVFKTPQCLIRAGKDIVFEVCEDVLDEISRIDKPCVIVAIAGLYRTGKSYLMNLIADANEGFALGDTIQSTTKGIWVWCRDHPLQKDTVLILLDTEGLGDVEKGDSNYDNRIFTLATLLCSTLVYNMKGAFDQDAVNKLTFVSEISKNIKYGGRCDENNHLLQIVLPGFVLALRDFSLRLFRDGNQKTSDEYLEESLESNKERGVSFNKPRECIRTFFPQDKRRCFAFPPPGDIEVLESLEKLTFKELSPRFQAVSTMFVSYIYSQGPKQLQVSKPVNGSMFATLTRQYVEAIAKGAVPDVDDAFATVAKIENQKVKDECMKIFRIKINEIQMPSPSKVLDIHFKDVRWSALEYMRTNAVKDVANVVEREAQMEMDLLLQQFRGQNDEACEKHCLDVLLRLPSVINLQTRLKTNAYNVRGGHKKFKQDVALASQEYKQTLPKFEPREIALVWSTFANELAPVECKIIEKDDELSEVEKKREKEENSKTFERMKVDMTKANQKALDKQKMEHDEQQKKLNIERERREKEHEDKMKELYNKIASLEMNKECQMRMIDQMQAVNNESRKEMIEANRQFEINCRVLIDEQRKVVEDIDRARRGRPFLQRLKDLIFGDAFMY